MSQSRLETKVGLFVLMGLVLLGVLAVLFSKGTAFYQRTFELLLKSNNVGGIKAGANVLVSGVPVGRVSGVDLDPDGRSVTIHLKIFQKYQLYDNARFEIEQFGFLGDQYIAIYPEATPGRLLQSGDEVECRNPFNMQETVAKAAETISRIGQVTTNVNQAVADVRRLVLTEEKLSNLGAALDRFAVLAADAQHTVSNINALVATNALPVTAAVSNLTHFSALLAPATERVTALITNNEAEIHAAIKNIEAASATLTNLMRELESGKGPAGRLLRDEALADDISALARNLATTSSNLNRGGLWSILWRKRDAGTNKPSTKSLTPPRNPFP